MSWLWTSEAMVEAMEGRPVGTLPGGVTGLSIDTRTLESGEAFFAIRGERFDGHDFASAAIAAGAGLLVVSEAKLPALGRLTVPMIVVEDVLAALAKLAAAARARSTAQIVAVTGSVGKTTTKEMLRAALSPSGSVHASTASFNNHWGVPLSLARMPAEARFGVFEIGMNHPDEIRPLVKMVRPHVAIVTAIAPAHLGNFADIDGIAAAKAEIFEGLEPGGAALINLDSDKPDLLRRLAAAAGVERILTFGTGEAADFRLLDAACGGASSRARMRIGGDEVAVSVGAPGRHLVDNALAVMATAALTRADLAAAATGLGGFSTGRGRGVRHALDVGAGRAVLIDESYNANPASMRAALGLLRDTPVGEGGRRIAVLGDMLELGRFSERLHAELAGPVAEAGVDLLCLAGPEMAALRKSVAQGPRVHYEADADAVAARLRDEIRPGDVVMVKASLGIGFGKVVAALTAAFAPAPAGRSAEGEEEPGPAGGSGPAPAGGAGPAPAGGAGPAPAGGAGPAPAGGAGKES